MFSDMELAIKYVGIAALSETQSRLDREQSSGFFPSSHARRAKRKNYANFKMAKKEERLGRERKKDDRGGFIVL